MKLGVIGILLCLLLSQTVWGATTAPQFRLKTLEDRTISLKAFRNRVVYVDFWASWCVPCRKSFPWMNEMRRKYHKQGLRIIAINLDTDKAVVKKFLAKYPARFKIALNPSGSIAEKYKVRGMPSAYLIDRRGRLVDAHIGFRDEDKAELEKAIVKLLRKK